MSLCDRIRGNRTKILKKLFREVLGTYPEQSRPMLAVESNRFGNPMGSTLSDGIEDIFDVVAGEKTMEEAELALARMFKLKAIQEGDNGDVLDFLFTMKSNIRGLCGADAGDSGELKEWLEIEQRIDDIVKRGLQIFVGAREKLLELQVSEMKHKTYSLRKLSGDLSEFDTPPINQDSKPINS